uniref:Uncharacterized protein n=1 Tax=Arundo donax TaxID=35708 RepID=A0A0A9C219_ARUDO
MGLSSRILKLMIIVIKSTSSMSYLPHTHHNKMVY